MSSYRVRQKTFTLAGNAQGVFQIGPLTPRLDVAGQVIEGEILSVGWGRSIGSQAVGPRVRITNVSGATVGALGEVWRAGSTANPAAPTSVSAIGRGFRTDSVGALYVTPDGDPLDTFVIDVTIRLGD